MLSGDDIKKQINNIDKNTAMDKLKQMGYGDIADKLSKTSEKQIIDAINQNPDIIKKVNQILGGGKNG